MSLGNLSAQYPAANELLIYLRNTAKDYLITVIKNHGSDLASAQRKFWIGRQQPIFKEHRSQFTRNTIGFFYRTDAVVALDSAFSEAMRTHQTSSPKL